MRKILSFILTILLGSTLFVPFSSNQILAQEKNTELQENLDSLAKRWPALNTKVDLSVGKASLQEVVRAIAHESGLNIYIDPQLQSLVSNNFHDVPVKDVLFFLVTQYDLEISFVGNIITLKQHQIEEPSVNPIKLEVSDDGRFLSAEINQASAREVAKVITTQTTINLACHPSAAEKKVSAFFQNLPLEEAITHFCHLNELSVEKKSKGLYIIRLASSSQKSSYPSHSSLSSFHNLHVEKGLNNTLSVVALNQDVKTILSICADSLGYKCCFLEEPKTKKSVNLKNATWNFLMEVLLESNNFSWILKENTILIGKRSDLAVNKVNVLKMEYRTIDSLEFLIPPILKNDVRIITYPDQNSIILSGPGPQVEKATRFLKKLDQLIPVVLIEVLIIETRDSRALSTGIEAGLAEEAPKTKGQVLPSVNMTLDSKAINNLIDGLNGFGWANIGHVTPEFYMTIKALEENGAIELKSTPQLSTLNGHTASMSIGNTEYYQEEQNYIYGTQNPQTQKTVSYKPVEAELAINIRPVVSGADQVTLNIEVIQSDFTERISQFAPPGKVSRKFQSLIRVKDQEMVLLGGLKEKKVSETHNGVPLLSRIPLLKYLFSSSKKEKSEKKLNILIKPVIIG